MLKSVILELQWAPVTWSTSLHTQNHCLRLRKLKQPSSIIPPTQVLLPRFSQETQLLLTIHLICCVPEMNKIQLFISRCSESEAGSRKQNAMCKYINSPDCNKCPHGVQGVQKNRVARCAEGSGYVKTS